MGSELYAHFTVTTDETIESDELRELAADAGGGEVPSAGEGRIVARLDPAADVKQGRRLSSGWMRRSSSCSIRMTAAT